MRRFDPLEWFTLLKEVGFLFASTAAGVWAWYRTRKAYSWPSAQGTIMSDHAQRSTDSQFQPWLSELSYNYVVNGEYYSGFYRIRARTERRAEERIAGWKDRMVVVRYSPDKHDLSVLLKSDQPGGQLGN